MVLTLFNDLNKIKSSGFEGFEKIAILKNNLFLIPESPGIYLVLRPENKEPEFLEKGTGGHFKGANPNVPIDTLVNKWVKNTIVVNIGKAGGGKIKSTLQSRIRDYLLFGSGKNIGHKGGRYIWQLKDSMDLIICWKKIYIEMPRDEEKRLINSFIDSYNKKPFANIYR